MKKLLTIINHRDFILSLALVFGLVLGDSSRILAEYSLFLLMLAMIASTVDFSFKSWTKASNIIMPLIGSFFLSYILYGSIFILLAWLVFHNRGMELIWTGFVIVAAVPPGPAVVSFSAMLKGDSNFSTTGLLGMYFLALFLTPAILFFFIRDTSVTPAFILGLMLKIIVIPIIISRFLRFPKILPFAQKASKTSIKWLFFLILTPIIGMNRDLLFNDLSILFSSILIFFTVMIVLGIIYNFIMVKILPDKAIIISSTFMFAIKGSAISAVIAFNAFGDEPQVAIPSAVAGFFTILFGIFYSIFVRYVLDRLIPQKNTSSQV